MSDVKDMASYDEIVEKIIRDGFTISDSDKEKYKEKIASVGYYHIKPYFRPFKSGGEDSESASSFDRIYRIYEFDRKLRHLIFGALGVMEVYLKSSLAFFHARKYGPLGYLDSQNFNKDHRAEEFQKTIEREITNNRKIPFVKHHIDQYEGKFPLWAVIELFTFGMLSRFYADMLTTDRKEFAGTKIQSKLISWLRCCTDLRNICAHHGRIYDRIFTSMPAELPITEEDKKRFWGVLLVVKELFPYAEKWNCEYVPALSALVEEYRNDILLKHLAFPDDWEQQLKKKENCLFYMEQML